MIGQYADFRMMGKTHFFNFSGVRVLYVAEPADSGEFTIYAGIDDVESPMAVVGYDTREDAERALWKLITYLNDGVILPDAEAKATVDKCRPVLGNDG